MTPTMPPVPEHIDAIEVAAGLLGAWATQAGPEVPVPTCPGWTVRDLLAHQGMVHRWATAVVRGDDPRAVDDAALEAEGREQEDPVAWLDAGAADLVTALRAAPDDLDVMTFLREAPPTPRLLGPAPVPRDDGARPRRAGRGERPPPDRG